MTVPGIKTHRFIVLLDNTTILALDDAKAWNTLRVEEAEYNEDGSTKRFRTIAQAKALDEKESPWQGEEKEGE